ncbi:hypothetical protein BK655_19250 [Pseudomonas brassicacearum]|jgi:hypothetical protein|nr:hypothetical protein A0U95_21670 [Pseudomonas brassicacearum]ROM80135.1 hypothetical protein BK655_19250 [Pseudomonas brassicacearum]ROM94011.1 hypothetical protein BK656_14550 [Pseudomonas brassicacearum]ROM99985.1 hypothetical protein BK657_20950 [Pseudomonas brassicacearum]
MIGISSQHRTTGHSMIVFISRFLGPGRPQDQKIAACGSSYRELASGMPEKLSDNDHGAWAPNALECGCGRCPFRGNNARMFADGAGGEAIYGGQAGQG